MQQLDDSQFDDWMRGTPDQGAPLMKPYAGAIEAWEVRAEVGNVKDKPAGADRAGGAAVGLAICPLEQASKPDRARVVGLRREAR